MISRDPEKLQEGLFLNRRLIGIDGDPGAGKSTLAKEVHDLVGGRIIALDDFLSSPGEPFLSQYKASGLAEEFGRSGPLPKIMEGVVLLDALEFLNLSADVMVFARREVDGVWDYAQHLQDCSRGLKSKSTQEIVAYYRWRKPWLSAQLCTTLLLRL